MYTYVCLSLCWMPHTVSTPALSWHLVADRGNTRYYWPGTYAPMCVINRSSLHSTDSGHFLHRPLRAAGCGERRLSADLLHAAALPLPGAGLCQGLKNPLVPARVTVGTGITIADCIQLKTNGGQAREATTECIPNRNSRRARVFYGVSVTVFIFIFCIIS